MRPQSLALILFLNSLLAIAFFTAQNWLTVAVSDGADSHHSIDTTAVSVPVIKQSLKKFVTRQHRTSPFIIDKLCGGCRHTGVNGSTRCGVLILDAQRKSANEKESNVDVEAAALKVIRDYPECKLCLECSKEERYYWRYDFVLAIQKATSHIMPSVPTKYRIPIDAIANVTTFFLSDEHAYPKSEYLFDYNPSIVQLPISQRIHQNAVYIASFRVSNRHFCLHPLDRALMMRGYKTPAIDWLGLALLDADLAIVKDTVVNMKAVGFAFAEDFRLFVLKGGLYIASLDQIAPIWLQNPPVTPTRLTIPTVFDGTNPFPVYIRSFASCAPCSKRRGLCGKNFNFFINASGTALAELWPSPPHVARVVDLDLACDRSQDPESTVDHSTPSRPSFATVEELLFPALGPDQVLLTRGRGGACCVELMNPNNKANTTVLVGIQHSKTPSQGKNRLLRGNITDNHYVSRLYAFQPEAPYKIVAQSGLFCLGFPNKQEQISVPLVRVTLWRKLVLGQEFDCPRIHFVSGITLKATEPSKVIIAYGINDCVSRMIEVTVRDLQQLLFGRATMA
jgi:hypothetical protein